MKWEMGSEFHWAPSDLIATNVLDWVPTPSRLYSTGRGALHAALASLNRTRQVRRVYLPSYYCMSVAAELARTFRIGWYRDLPTEPYPDFSGVQINADDVVVAANLFGQRSGLWWAEWMRSYSGERLVEDHSHDPLSRWSRNSNAAFAFASLRKTMPIPDGALVWSPLGLEVPTPREAAGRGSFMKLMAMTLKGAYLQGARIEVEAYRELQLLGEDELVSEGDHAACSFTTQALRALDVQRLRATRDVNSTHFYRAVLGTPNRIWQPVRAEVVDGSVPFCGLIVCNDVVTRDRLRSYLKDNRVYCPIHWPQPADGISSHDDESISLASRMLSVPLDHRYSEEDVQHVVGLLRAFH